MNNEHSVEVLEAIKNANGEFERSKIEVQKDLPSVNSGSVINEHRKRERRNPEEDDRNAYEVLIDDLQEFCEELNWRMKFNEDDHYLIHLYADIHEIKLLLDESGKILEGRCITPVSTVLEVRDVMTEISRAV